IYLHPVKSLTVILAMYIMGISVLPCSELIQDCLFDIGQQELTEFDSQFPDNHNGDAHDHCSPFCVCDCCGAHVITMDIPITFTVAQSTPCSIPSISKTLVSDPEPGDIWQPPKHS
ncbi:MAG: hypothetical protein DRI69_05580, partial [Bacteroidetes bacterium]